MDKMVGGFNDRAEIAANLIYPIGVDGNCTKQEIFLEGAAWAFQQFKAVLQDVSELGNNISESEYWTEVIYGQLTRKVDYDALIVGNKAMEGDL